MKNRKREKLIMIAALFAVLGLHLVVVNFSGSLFFHRIIHSDEMTRAVIWIGFSAVIFALIPEKK